MIRGGGELVSFYAKEPELAAAYAKRHPEAKRREGEREILEDPQIQLVVSAGIPNERAPLGVRVMRHGKDYMVDKPGITTLEQLEEVRQVQAETKRIYSICYSERLENRATVRAGELVKAGAIGRVVQTVGLGPHRANLATRPAWFFVREQYGGILCDIASHQFDQFLYFTGSTKAEVVASQVANVDHPQHPGLEDFGDAHGARGRRQWLHPRRLVHPGRPQDLGRRAADHPRHRRLHRDPQEHRPGGARGRATTSSWWTRRRRATSTASDVALPYGRQLVDDVLHRTETAMPQAHCFLAMELALRAQAGARKGSFRA